MQPQARPSRRSRVSRIISHSTYVLEIDSSLISAL
ncbi:hypothetical protein CGCA056_v006513 [Colletotrichum aenigma]|nr:uncharacterized protein CGCA056_v006513 [Colletotrichum aenigma]KAF5521857.1 hypothetical protein CGCA056_v006513 [Colletotrichum aenigma]